MNIIGLGDFLKLSPALRTLLQDGLFQPRKNAMQLSIVFLLNALLATCFRRFFRLFIFVFKCFEVITLHHFPLLFSLEPFHILLLVSFKFSSIRVAEAGRSL